MEQRRLWCACRRRTGAVRFVGYDDRHSCRASDAQGRASAACAGCAGAARAHALSSRGPTGRAVRRVAPVERRGADVPEVGDGLHQQPVGHRPEGSAGAGGHLSRQAHSHRQLHLRLRLESLGRGQRRVSLEHRQVSRRPRRQAETGHGSPRHAYDRHHEATRARGYRRRPRGDRARLLAGSVESRRRTTSRTRPCATSISTTRRHVPGSSTMRSSTPIDTGIVGWWNDEADDSGVDTQFLNMQRALYDGQRAHSTQRVWSVNRNFYLGSQRYAYGVWSGDIQSGFASMAAQRQRMLAAFDVGAMHWGMDGGGFKSPPPQRRELRALDRVRCVHADVPRARRFRPEAPALGLWPGGREGGNGCDPPALRADSVHLLPTNTRTTYTVWVWCDRCNSPTRTILRSAIASMPGCLATTCWCRLSSSRARRASSWPCPRAAGSATRTARSTRVARTSP